MPNVTLKLDDALCRAARHRAVDAGVSLSGWVAEILKRELSNAQEPGPKSLLELLGSDDSRDYEFPRSDDRPREVAFS
jgi:hypothetical protein